MTAVESMDYSLILGNGRYGFEISDLLQDLFSPKSMPPCRKLIVVQTSFWVSSATIERLFRKFAYPKSTLEHLEIWVSNHHAELLLSEKDEDSGHDTYRTTNVVNKFLRRFGLKSIRIFRRKEEEYQAPGEEMPALQLVSRYKSLPEEFHICQTGDSIHDVTFRCGSTTNRVYM
jgi:hypothetical protein